MLLQKRRNSDEATSNLCIKLVCQTRVFHQRTLSWTKIFTKFDIIKFDKHVFQFQVWWWDIQNWTSHTAAMNFTSSSVCDTWIANNGHEVNIFYRCWSFTLNNNLDEKKHIKVCSLLCPRLYNHWSRATEIPCPTFPTCPISLGTSRKFQFTCPGTRTSKL